MPNIQGIVCSVPSSKLSNSVLEEYHDPEYVKKSTNLIGVQSRYWVKKETTLSMCVSAGKNLINHFSKIHKNKNFI